MGRQRPSVVSLFSGAGGLDAGLGAAGFETRAAVEMSAVACRTLRRNWDWATIESDICQVPSELIRSAAGVDVGELDVLVGGPPCQPFSKAAFWASGDTLRLSDPRARTVREYLRVVRDLLPKTFLMENVPGMGFADRDEAIRLIERSLGYTNRTRGTNYRISVAKLNCADYGVPQARERIFVVGSRDGSEFEFPEPTHARPGGEQPQRSPWLTTWDAIGDISGLRHRSLGLSGRWARLLPSIPEGKNYLHHTDRGDGKPLFGWRTRYWAFLLKLAKATASWTIAADPGPAIGPFHWKNRRLSVREMCRLQTIPDDYEIVGTEREARRQLGNAVPSLVAEVLGLEIRRQLLGSLSRRRAPKLALDVADAIPRRSPTRQVAGEYLHLAGEHEAHPGTGRGPGATKARRETAAA